jgi:MOSC domain-containing protein YiiM
MIELKWIGLRPARKAKIKVVQEVEVDSKGLVGDRYDIDFGSRNVTLIRQEGLDNAWKKLNKEGIADPALARRNLVIQGLDADLKKMKGEYILIGDNVKLEVTGYCHPCTRMDENFGTGGLKALSGQGGLTAMVVQTGKIRVGDTITIVQKA